MKKIYKITVILLLITSNLVAQDRSNIYTNLLNPFLYNPSLSNSSDNIYTCFNARGFVGGIDGSQRSYNFAIYSPLNNGTGIGAKVLTTSVGIFQTINAEGAYSKLVKFDRYNNLSLGLSLGLTQLNIKSDLLNGQVDLSDQSINSPDLNKIMVSSGAGATYRYKKSLEVSVSFPMIITGDKPMNSFLIANAAWNIYTGIDKEWKIKPMVNYYNLTNSPHMIDMLVGGSWNDVVSITSGYRTNGSLIMAAGFNFKSLAINYAYYYHVNDLQKLAPAQNEIGIAFMFNKPQPKIAKKEPANDQVIDDEIDKLNERLTGLINVAKTNPGLINIKKEMSKINVDIEKILKKYKITNTQQLQKIKELQNNINEIIAKYND
jgi:type IX secretion system PorP/SprF family membrane protein